MAPLACCTPTRTSKVSEKESCVLPRTTGCGMHASFVNGWANWASLVRWVTRLSSACTSTGRPSDVRFLQASSLYGAAVPLLVLRDDSSGMMDRGQFPDQVPGTLGSPSASGTDHPGGSERLTLWQELLDRRDEPLDETPLVHAVTTAESRSDGQACARYSQRGLGTVARGSVADTTRRMPRRRPYP